MRMIIIFILAKSSIKVQVPLGIIPKLEER